MKVQLANTYNSSKKYPVASWYATPKFDGVRAVFIPHKGFFTRNEKPISGFRGFHVFAIGGRFIDTADMLRNLPDMP